MFAVTPRLTSLLTACCLLFAPLLARAGEAPGAERMLHTRGTPAQVDGLWCGIGLLHEFTLRINQQSETFDALLSRKGKKREVTGHIEGSTLRTDPQRNVVLVLKALNDELRITHGTGQFALAQGQGFARAQGSSCDGSGT